MHVFIVKQEITVDAETHEEAANIARKWQLEGAFAASNYEVTSVGENDSPSTTKHIDLFKEYRNLADIIMLVLLILGTLISSYYIYFK